MQTIEITEERRVTVEPDDYERERGKPLPNLSHAVVEMRLGAIFLAQSKARFIVAAELTLEFDDGASLTPDIAVLPARPISWGLEPTRCHEVPLLVVEIDSPTQGYLEVMKKRDAYFLRGVESVWVVQPASQSINIYLPGEARPQIVQVGEAQDRTTGLTARLEEIFS